MFNPASALGRAVVGVVVVLVGMSAGLLLSDRFDSPWNVVVFVACVIATFAATVWFLAWTGRSQRR